MCKNPKCPNCNIELQDVSYGKFVPIFNDKNEFGKWCAVDKMGVCPICGKTFIWQATFALLKNSNVEEFLC